MRKSNGKHEPAKGRRWLPPRHTYPQTSGAPQGKALRDQDAARRAWRLESRPRVGAIRFELLREANEGRIAALDPVTAFPAWPIIAFRLLSQGGRNHGGRSGLDANVWTSRPGLRRRSPDEFRRLRNARAQHLLRHQRFRRNPAGTLGNGIVKRLAASIVIAARHINLPDSAGAKAATESVCSVP